MVEQVFNISRGNNRIIEKVIQDENIHYNHMVLNHGEGLPEHFSNSIVYMTVLKGKLYIRLGEQDACQYDAGTVLKIPINIKMNVKNLDTEVLELIVIKAPAPSKLEQK